LSVEIKGITVPALLIRIEKGVSFNEVKRSIEEKLKSTIFKNSIFVIEDKGNCLTQEQREELEELISKNQAKVLGYKSSSEEKKEEKLPKIKEKKALKIINKTLRSGQSVEYDGDILIIGDVNPDAYITASGNIIVMGALRGIAHAGADGDETASIIALKLVPQQLRIAGYYTRSPDAIEEPEKPERAYIENGQIFIEELR